MYFVWTIVLGNQINCFPLHIKFKVHGSSIMEFPDWFQVKVKTLYMQSISFCFIDFESVLSKRYTMYSLLNSIPAWQQLGI